MFGNDREKAELAAMRDLHSARDAHERAADLQCRAQRAMADAEIKLGEARREVRRIAEAKPRAGTDTGWA